MSLAERVQAAALVLFALGLTVGCQSAPRGSFRPVPAAAAEAVGNHPAGAADGIMPAAYHERPTGAVRPGGPEPRIARGIVAPVVPELAGPHAVEDYIAFAFEQNPDIQAARQRVDAMADRVPQAASLEDPMVEAAYPSEAMHDSIGIQQYGAMQKFPWFGKLRTRAGMAEAETNIARAELAAAELEVVSEVKHAYYELYSVQKALEITEHDRELLSDFARIAHNQYTTGDVSQQDELRAELELSNLDNERIVLGQQLQSAQAWLARLLHISPETQLRALAELPRQETPPDVERLYEQAVAARPELHAQLAAVARDRRQVELARLEARPDVTARTMWMDMPTGADALVAGVSVNVPIYRQRLDAAVREAEANRLSSVRSYDSLRDRTQQEVKDLFVQVTSQEDLLRLFRHDIIPKADHTLEVSIKAYQAGRIDFLQLIDNWRQLLKFQIAFHRLEAQLRQNLAALERLVGGPLTGEAAPGEVPRPPATAEPLPAPPRAPDPDDDAPATKP